MIQSYDRCIRAHAITPQWWPKGQERWNDKTQHDTGILLFTLAMCGESCGQRIVVVVEGSIEY